MGPEVKFGQLTQVYSTELKKVSGEKPEAKKTEATFGNFAGTATDVVSFRNTNTLENSTVLPQGNDVVLAQLQSFMGKVPPQGPSFGAVAGNLGRDLLGLNEKPAESAFIKENAA